MNKRIRVGHRHGSAKPRHVLDHFFTRPRRQRKAWTFEKLEERHYFSATPLAAGEITSYSSNTPEGLQAILDNELAWAIAQYANQQGLSASLATPYAVPNDPYFEFQWHLFNSGELVGSPDYQDIFGKPGEDINVLPVWDDYTGAGIVVAVVDTGTQITHPDLAPNFIDPPLQFNALNGSNNANPDLLDPANAHGTAVAGLIAAKGNNGIGMTGVAYDAQIVPILLIPGPLGGPETSDALLFANQIVDIYNNSWGPADAGDRVVYSLSPLETLALRDGVIFGRDLDGPGGNDPLGSIFVFASGNDAGPVFSAGFSSIGDWDSAGYNGFINSRYTIGVGGIDHDGSYNNIDGTVTDYMEAGPSILVAAPTGSFPIQIADDIAVGSGIWTTDAVGDDGFNAAPLPNGLDIDPTLDLFADTDYTSRFNGTSAAAPLVSGVIALMLDANPNLTWRDVQEILVRSSRQAGQFESPEIGGGLTNRNSWLINPISFFYNPDPYIDPAIDPTFNATNAQLSPVPFMIGNPAGANGALLNYDVYKPPRPLLFTNGAGYTVSQGLGAYGEQFGYGHGVVDAELAVQLAEQWHTKDQALAPELTYTTFVRQPGQTIPAGAVGGAGLGVPGALGGGDFIGYYDEYFAMDPFVMYAGPGANARGGFLHFEVPDSNAMSVESIEVRVDINVTGGDAAVNNYDFLRISLVSPSGTVSELNHYSESALGGGRQDEVLSPLSYDPPGSMSPGGNLTYTFSSNRNWGERYDLQTIIDPATGNPFLDSVGGVVQQGWEIHIENYSPVAFTLTGIEIAWHGQPISPDSQRIQGAVGIDSGRFGQGAQDGFFNFDRYFQTIADSDADGVVDFNEAVRTADPFQERFAANVTVNATRVSDGVVVAQFVTGADGNFYFDLVPDEYIISVDDPLGRDAKDEDVLDPTLAMNQQLAHYKTEWHITPDWFFVPEVDNSDPIDFRVVTDMGGEPIAFEDMVNPPTASGVKNVNFLLDPGVLPADEVVVSGNVYADIAGDGAFNGDDVGAPGFIVYADTNKSGQFEATDIFVLSGADGDYTLTIPTFEADRFTIGAVPLNTNWIPTNPATAQVSIVGFPGDEFNNTDFAFQPTNGSGNPIGGETGSILGVAFEDKNGDGVRQANEQGIPNLRVFVDLGVQDGVWTAGEPFAMTAANGAYFLADVGPGAIRVVSELPDPTTWALTTPAAGFATVQLLSDGTVTNVRFGMRNLATLDFGDLPDETILAGARYDIRPDGTFDPPSHVIVPGFRLGNINPDGELASQPSLDAKGDGIDEDGADGTGDGVKILSTAVNPGAILIAGTAASETTVLEVTVEGFGGMLTGWIDFDGNGMFDADEKLTWKDPTGALVTEVDLSPGTYELPITVNPDLVAGNVAARFRWGEAGLNYYGPAIIGEVEDYWFDPPAVGGNLPGDYDGSGVVDDADYAFWKSNYGATSGPGLAADGNGDGKVNSADYSVWRNNEGAVAAAAQGAAAAAGASTSTSTPDPAAARAAAYARAMSALQQPIDGSTTEAVAQLVAAGAVPMTIRVGNGTQTVYYFPDQQSVAATTDLVDSSTLDVTNEMPSLPAMPSLVADTPSGDNAMPRFDLTGVQFQVAIGPRSATAARALAPNSSAAAIDAGLQLLANAWAVTVDDFDAADLPSLALASCKEEDDEGELALAAAFDDVRDWRSGI